MKRYIRGTGAGFPMVQEYLENAGGAVSIEDNMGNGTVVTVSLDPKRVQEIERAGGRGAAVRHASDRPGCRRCPTIGRHAGRPANGLSTVPARVSIPTSTAAGVRVRPAVSATVPAGIPTDIPAGASAAIQPLGTAGTGAALPTVAAKFSTADAAHAEFSTTSSSNGVS